MASGASNATELEPFLTPPIRLRVTAAMNPDADVAILDRFANDKFWVVCIIEVVNHLNVSDTTLVKLLDTQVSKRRVVHHAAYKKLIERGMKIDEDIKLNVNQEQ